LDFRSASLIKVKASRPWFATGGKLSPLREELRTITGKPRFNDLPLQDSLVDDVICQSAKFYFFTKGLPSTIRICKSFIPVKKSDVTVAVEATVGIDWLEGFGVIATVPAKVGGPPDEVFSTY